MEGVINGKFDKLTAGKADIWRERIEAQRASGQSVRVWCQGNNAREHSFYWWRAKLGLSPQKSQTRAAPPRRVIDTADFQRGGQGVRRHGDLGFAQVVVDSGRPSITEPRPAGASIVEPLRLRLAAGRELILPGSMPLDQVAQLVRALEATP
jgi:hypothetical protein